MGGISGNEGSSKLVNNSGIVRAKDLFQGFSFAKFDYKWKDPELSEIPRFSFPYYLGTDVVGSHLLGMTFLGEEELTLMDPTCSG